MLGVRFPDVPMPDDCQSILDDTPANSHTRTAFFKNFDCRIAYGPRFWIPGWTAGPARYARWFRYLTPPRDADGRLDRAAFSPIVDTTPPTLAHALGPSTYRFFAPSLDLTVHVLDDTDRDWILMSARMRRARAGYATAEVEVWDDSQRFLAYATQTMLIRTVAGSPPSGVTAPW
jgi:acyl-CoA thioesterase